MCCCVVAARPSRVPYVALPESVIPPHNSSPGIFSGANCATFPRVFVSASKDAAPSLQHHTGVLPVRNRCAPFCLLRAMAPYRDGGSFSELPTYMEL